MPSSGRVAFGWLANPVSYSTGYMKFPEASPVNGRPVRFDPCAPGANPSTSTRAKGRRTPEQACPSIPSLDKPAASRAQSARDRPPDAGSACRPRHLDLKRSASSRDHSIATEVNFGSSSLRRRGFHRCKNISSAPEFRAETIQIRRPVPEFPVRRSVVWSATIAAVTRFYATKDQNEQQKPPPGENRGNPEKASRESII